MKSKAQLKSHPLHPILVAFPIAFYIGALLFDALGMITCDAGFAATGRHLNIAGIVGAVAAAVPGFIDYLYTVPPKSSAGKRAAKHGLLNTTVLLIFTTVLWYRQRPDAIEAIVVGAEAVGVALTMAAGWLGGTLVYRNQIGVDIRYADAGKWKEEHIDAEGGSIRVDDASELGLNGMKLIHAAGRRIVLARTEDGYVAFDDRCTHRGGSLAGGAMICGTVQCPWHGSQFDTRTGEVKAGPAGERIRTYAVEAVGEGVVIRV